MVDKYIIEAYNQNKLKISAPSTIMMMITIEAMKHR